MQSVPRGLRCTQRMRQWRALVWQCVLADPR
jgi:hypothetical protein